MGTTLAPVLVFGTGLTRQLLQETDAKDSSGPLICWQTLLREISLRAGVPEIWNPGIATAPTLLWEELVRAYVAKSGDQKTSKTPAARAELELKRFAAKILADATSAARGRLESAKLAQLTRNLGAHVVSLNFDTLLVEGDHTPSVAPLDETRKLPSTTS